MKRRSPYTVPKLVGDILLTGITAGGWLLFRIPWELYMWAGPKK